MKNIFLLIIMAISTCLMEVSSLDSSGQTTTYSANVATNRAVIKENSDEDELNEYQILREFKGDLNQDKIIYKIVVLEKLCAENDSSYIKDANCRRVDVYLNKNGKDKLIASNGAIIECSECGGAGVGDPFQDIKIKGGYFSVETLYGACDKTAIVTTFRFNKKENNFYLYKVGTDNYNCRTESENINGKTIIKTGKDFGKVKFQDYKPNY